MLGPLQRFPKPKVTGSRAAFFYRPRSFGLAPAFPSGARSYQTLTFYPALTYGLDGDRIDSANFRIIGVGNRGLSGIVYRTKVATADQQEPRLTAKPPAKDRLMV